MRSLLIAAALLIPVLPIAAQDSAPARAGNAVAVGLGLDAGLFGIKYAHRLRNSALDASLGLGFAGIAPSITWRALEGGAWSAYASGGVLYSPTETLLTSAGTALAVGGLGVQRWPRGGSGVYLNAGVEPYIPVLGGTEGDQGFGLSFRAQVGLAF